MSLRFFHAASLSPATLAQPWLPLRYTSSDILPSTQWEQNRSHRTFLSQSEFSKWAAGAANFVFDKIQTTDTSKLWNQLLVARQSFSKKMQAVATPAEPWLEDPSLVGFPRRWADLLPVEEGQWRNEDLIQSIQERLKGRASQKRKWNRYTQKGGTEIVAGKVVRKEGKLHIEFAAPEVISLITEDAFERIDAAARGWDGQTERERVTSVLIAMRGIYLAQPVLKGVAACTEALGRGAILKITGRTMPFIDGLNLQAIAHEESDFLEIALPLLGYPQRTRFSSSPAVQNSASRPNRSLH